MSLELLLFGSSIFFVVLSMGNLSFFLSVVCICVCMSTLLSILRCARTCGGQRLTADVFLSCSPLCLPRWRLSLNLELSDQASLVSHLAQCTPCLRLWSPGIIDGLPFVTSYYPVGNGPKPLTCGTISVVLTIDSEHKMPMRMMASQRCFL